jgi:hypothetical protein
VNYSLTLKGGWAGCTPTCVSTIDTNDPSIISGSSLSIINWVGSVTINDVVITGATTNPNGVDAALYIDTSKSITLNRVQVIDNTAVGFDGAHLDNRDAPPGAPAPITINDSVFNGQYGSGLIAQSEGAIKARNLTANYNGWNDSVLEYGAYLDNWWGADINQPITLSGTNEFKGNFGTGLMIDSYGAVTLNNITAYANDDASNDSFGNGSGVVIQNNHGSTASNVKLTGTNRISSNQLDGLYISATATSA